MLICPVVVELEPTLLSTWLLLFVGVVNVAGVARMRSARVNDASLPAETQSASPHPLAYTAQRALLE
jgi:hypothetical protein